MPLLLLLTAATALGADPSIPCTHYELDNGLDVVLAPDHSTPIVFVDVWYHVGSKDEGEGLTGFAHLFEHLMFQGSSSNPGEYFQPLQEVGGIVNGSTNIDRTNYYQTVPASELPLALWLESDRMASLLDVLDQARLDEQREVVRNERRQNYEGPPYGEVPRFVAEALWPVGHPYHHLTIGSHEDLQNATLDDVKAFFRTWYVPSNASLVIAGDFDPKQAKKLVQWYFGGIAAGAAVQHAKATDVVLAQSVVVRKYLDVPERRLVVAWPTPKLFATGDAELDLFASVFGQGKDSRLYQVLVKERQLAKSVNAFQSSAHLQSRFQIEATPSAGHTTDEVLAAIDEVLADLLGAHPPTPEEIATAKAQYDATFYRNLTTINGKGEQLNQYLFNAGRPDFLAQDHARYTVAAPVTVLAESKKALSTHRVVVHVLPKADDPAALPPPPPPGEATPPVTP